MVHKSEAARDVLADAAKRASEAGRRLKELSTAIQETAHDTVETTRRGSLTYANRLRGCVADYPLASISIALAVGAMLTVLFAARR
jgi:ElaB/YqjD/DUF883 family membrane-anchored ribosome-binding protein